MNMKVSGRSQKGSSSEKQPLKAVVDLWAHPQDVQVGIGP